MKLFIKTPAPSALRVQIFLDECGQTVETIEVADTGSAEFARMNPFRTVPVLETDRGTFVSESLTICRYLDSIWSTRLFGSSLEERVEVEMWERRAELQLFVPAIEYVHQTHPMFSGKTRQNAEWALEIAERVRNAAPVFDDQLSRSPFLGGDDFSVADITGLMGLGAFAAFGVLDLSTMPALQRWSEMIAARPSMQRLRSLSL